MNLEKLYNEVKKYIDKIDFSLLWSGFKPLKFALYTKDLCFFNGEYIPKTEQFLANTSIDFNGEYIAIWNIQEDIPVEVLVSKMVHEMFHGFQRMNNETRFPDEMKALTEYQYLDDNLSTKYLESELLIKLFDNYQKDDFDELLSIRRSRFLNHKNEYEYEAKVEQIEGSANFVELLVLKQISIDAFNKKVLEMKNSLTNKHEYLPIRIISYDIGALLLYVLHTNQIVFDSSFNDSPFSISILDKVKEKPLSIKLNFQSIIDNYYSQARKIIKDTLLKNNVILKGEYELLGVNIYDAVYIDSYIISTFFVMYKSGNESKVLDGDFVIEMKNNLINRIYQIE